MAFRNTQSAQNTNILYAHKNTETYTGCDCPSERISSFVETLPSPHCAIATIPCKGYHYFYNFLDKTKIGKDTILGSNVYTYIPQEEGTNVVCQASKKFLNHPMIGLHTT